MQIRVGRFDSGPRLQRFLNEITKLARTQRAFLCPSGQAVSLAWPHQIQLSFGDKTQTIDDSRFTHFSDNNPDIAGSIFSISKNGRTELDIIENLKTFISVVDTGNFTRASRKLKVAVAVVKKRIDHLEEQAGVKLFERSTRSMTLTDAGRRHLLKTRAAVSQVDQLLAQMASKPDRVEGHLRIKVPNGLLGALIGEKLNHFQDLNPAIAIEVLSIDRPVNPVEEGFDVSIMLGPITWPGVIDFTIAPIKRHLVASPSYLAKRGRPQVPGDLRQHDILNYEPRGLNWTFQGKSAPLEVRIEPRLNSNNALQLLKATCMGNGICLLGEHITNPYTQSGELVTVLENYPLADIWVRMHIPEDRLELSHVQALRTHLLSSMSGSAI